MTKTAQHTKGPWHRDGTMVLKITEKHAGGFDRKLLAKTHFETDYDVPGHDENMANARLIAAAPETAEERDRLKEINKDLLEALKLFTVNLREGIEGTFPQHLKYMLDDFYKTADEAVAKKEGR